jgi:benzoyl-CoA reductase/2-hydroxyglutaryl-CoA dehydratase subunit BcrC/BadD/HgdB
LGYVGIPPICGGLYEFLEGRGARVVFNEFQRQFSMPAADPPAADLVAQYLAYTYPYGVAGRIEDLRRAVAERRLDGLVHYVQTFCFRHIQDRLLREGVQAPMLTLEFDRPGPLARHGGTRLEAFLEMLENRTEEAAHNAERQA